MSLERDRTSWSWRDWLMMLAITAVGALIRFIRLSEPSGHVFDEAFYARDSCLYAGLKEAVCAGREHLEVHPPLAKWMIASGIEVFGYDALGWRIVAAAAGTLTVAAVFLLARNLLDSTSGAALASGLFAFDFLHFVLSRVAMLDVFLTFFSTMAFALLAIERKEMIGSGHGNLAARLGIGVCCGAAIASKWSGGLTLIACIWLVLAWSSAQQTGSSSFIRLARALREKGPSLLVTLIVLPFLVYAATFVGRLGVANNTAVTEWGSRFVAKQSDMLNFHRHTIETTIASSPPWSWPLIKRPVPFFVNKSDPVVEVWFGGNPLVWWPALLALVYSAIRWVRKQDPREPAGFIVGGFLLLYAPWLLLTIPPFTWARSLVFIFYLLPALPFMYLGLAYVIRGVMQPSIKNTAAGALVAASLGGFAFFYPILSAQPIPRQSWSARVGWFDDCERPPPPTLEFPDRTGSGVVTLTLDSSDPPPGWCWK